jgi:hypothetical protein
MSHMTTNYVNPLVDSFEQVHGFHGRMLVETGSVSPTENRQYFMFHEFAAPSAGQEVVKVVVAGNTIMNAFSIKTMAGSARIEIVAGGTESGTFSEVVPKFPVNGMTTAAPRASTTTVTSGGTLTGGTTMDLFLVNTGDNVNQSSGVTSGEDFAIGFPAGTYYIRITNTDNSTAAGLVKALWTEL